MMIYGGLTTGEFISFIGALAMFMDPVRRFSKANTKLNQARAAASRIFKLLDEKEENCTVVFFIFVSMNFIETF